MCFPHYCTYQWKYDVMFQKRSRQVLDKGMSKAQIQEVQKPAMHMPKLWKIHVVLAEFTSKQA